MHPPSPETPAQRLIAAITAWRAAATAPTVIAIDGHGSAGKSTIAEQVAAQLAAALIRVDDFFRESSTRVPAGAPPMALYYDWQRLRRAALEPLRAGRPARFRAFDWETDAFRPGEVAIAPSDLIVLEGVSSSAPALAELVDRTVLVATPAQERHARTRTRIPAQLWDERWLAAERAYFATRPPEAFDLVVSGSSTDAV